jgi:hypothetical protein
MPLAAPALPPHAVDEPPSPAKPRRRSRAKPRPPRPREVVVAELRGLGGLVLEQALLEASARPLPSLTSWTDRLSRELDLGPAPAVETYAELMHQIAAIGRRAEENPRPTVALARAA